MKTRNFYSIFFLLLVVSCLFNSTKSIAQSETHDFITYDTLINGPSAQGLYGITWRLRISRPVGMFGNGPDSQSRPLIMFSPGQGEMGTDYSKLQFAGPHFWLNNGWDGGITLPNGKHYPILITAISSNKYFTGKEYAELLNIILSIYHIKRNAVNVGGLSQGGFASSSSIYYERVPGDEFGMKQITSLLSLQGVDEWPCGFPSTANKYAGAAWEQWARKYGGKFLGLEGTSDPRSINIVRDQVNLGAPGNGYLGYENIAGGGHCCWNDMMNPSRTSWKSVSPYGANMTSGVAPTSMGTYKDGDYLMKWMLLQGDISLVGGGSTPPNLAPVVNAGYAQTITLPSNSISLNGYATDSDGNIATSIWSKVSGPAASITNPSGYSTTVTGLVAGTYVFRLSATDNSGSTGSAEVTITVNAASSTPMPPAGGALTIPGKIESENYSNSNNVRTDASMDFGGTNLVGWINQGSWMDYGIKVANAGVYIVNLRIAAPAAGSQLQIRNAAGEVLSTVNIPNTNSYITWQTISTTITLPAGDQTLRVYAVTAGWNINWMEFISNGGGAPSAGNKTIPGKIESESYDAMNSIQTEVCADVNGGRYVGWISAGSWMDYHVNVSGGGGLFSVNLRIAAPAAGSQLQLRNAAGTVLATVNIPNTGSYVAWQTITASVRLTAGNQTIRMFAVNAGWNINWMEFIDQSSSPELTGPSTGYVALPARIQSEDFKVKNNVKTDASMDVSGGSLVGWIYPGSWMDYNVYSPIGGQYSVNLRIASPNWGSQLQIRNAAGEVLSTVNIPNTNSYVTWQTISTTVTLPAGDQTLRVYAVTSGWNINWMEFIAETALLPGLTGPSAGFVALPATIQSEDYTGKNNVNTDASMDVYGGSLVGWIYPGSWMDYNVYSPIAGQYTVNLRIASPNWGSQLQIRNAAGEVLSTVNIPNTNSYIAWQTISSIISLPAGNQTIRVYAITAGWNINWMEFTNGAALMTQSTRVVTSTTATSNINTAEKPIITGSTIMHIFPNPVNENFTLELNNTLLGSLKIQIVDLSGAVKKIYSLKKEQMVMRTNLSAAGLPPGSYFIRVTIGEWKEVRKMIKL